MRSGPAVAHASSVSGEGRCVRSGSCFVLQLALDGCLYDPHPPNGMEEASVQTGEALAAGRDRGNCMDGGKVVFQRNGCASLATLALGDRRTGSTITGGCSY